ncbi:hypothetical protein [Nostoc sp.]
MIAIHLLLSDITYLLAIADSTMSEKTPASQMIRVPTALVTAVKELSTLHRQGTHKGYFTGITGTNSKLS